MTLLQPPRSFHTRSVGFFQKLSRYVDDVLLLPDEARELVERAQRQLDEGHAADALDAASKALEIRRDHPQILQIAGEAMVRLGEHVEGEHLLREALEVDSEHAPSRLSLGRLLRRSSRPEEAAEQLRRAVPQFVGVGDKVLAADALFELSRCHLALGRRDRAARELRKAVALGLDDVEVHRTLARVLIDLGEEGAARAAARHAVEQVAAVTDGVLLRRVGEVALDAGLDDDARGLFERALDLGEPVQLQLARAALSRGDAMSAHEHALRALADDPGAAEPHRIRASLALRAGDYRGALSALEAAVVAEPLDVETLRQALTTAARVDLGRAGFFSDSLLAIEPKDVLAQIVRARCKVSAGDLAGGRRSFTELEEHSNEFVELWLGQAELALAEGQGEEALEALERAETVEPGRAEIDSLGAAACRLVAAAGSGGEPDLFDVLEGVHGLLASRPGLSELSVEVGRIREDYDKPLLLTVMGEFNAGKSTFINALVGEPVAPMGITPTTATINVLKYGVERKVRVLHRSGVVKELEYEALGGWLKGLSREAAVEVRQVEILYPAEELTRVNLVDTPGFNSIVAEHETVARRFIERADAVVWLFDAGQPGKESEREALARVAAQGKQVLGVLNKADRLTPVALEEVIQHLAAEELQGLVEGVVPLAARTALDAKSGTTLDEVALAQSGLPELEQRLDEVFYSRARLIKGTGCALRLVNLLERAVATETAANAELRRAIAALDDAAEALKSLPEGILADALERVDDELLEVRREVAREAAREVLEFVRPRRHALDSHRFRDEDRLFLIELIEDRLSLAMGGLVEYLATLASQRVDESWIELRDFEEGLLTTSPEAQAEAREFGQMVTWSILAFQRGLVRGGRADQFFDDHLPRIELEEAEIARHIEKWWRGTESQLREELLHGAEELAGRLARKLREESSRIRAELARRRRSGVRPLSGFAALAREWSEIR